jgi:hypothetical protein
MAMVTMGSQKPSLGKGHGALGAIRPAGGVGAHRCDVALEGVVAGLGVASEAFEAGAITAEGAKGEQRDQESLSHGLLSP